MNRFYEDNRDGWRQCLFMADSKGLFCLFNKPINSLESCCFLLVNGTNVMP